MPQTKEVGTNSSRSQLTVSLLEFLEHTSINRSFKLQTVAINYTNRKLQRHVTIQSVSVSVNYVSMATVRVSQFGLLI